MRTLPPSITLNGGEFRIEAVLGRGGFGIAYGATRLATGRAVAIKEFCPRDLDCDRLDDDTVVPAPQERQRFEAWQRDVVGEARLLANISDRGVVKVFDPFQENGTTYLVMAYVRGQPLKELLVAPWSEMRVRTFVAELARILGVVHGRGVVHRDLTPSNIIVDDDDNPTVIDFGLARLVDSSPTKNVGTVGFAAPEQMEGGLGPISAATDVYALGVLARTMLTGRAPTTYRPGEPITGATPAMAAAIVHATRRNPAERPQSVAQFLDEFQGVVTAPGAKEEPLPPPPGGSPGDGGTPDAPWTGTSDGAYFPGGTAVTGSKPPLPPPPRAPAPAAPYGGWNGAPATKNWFARNPIITVIVAILAALLVIGFVSNAAKKNEDAGTGETGGDDSTVTVPTTLPGVPVAHLGMRLAQNEAVDLDKEVPYQATFESRPFDGADLEFSMGDFDSGGLQLLGGAFYPVQPDATQAECEQIIEADGDGQGLIGDDAQKGETYCFRTDEGQVARLTLTELNSDTPYATFDLTTWGAGGTVATTSTTAAPAPPALHPKMRLDQDEAIDLDKDGFYKASYESSPFDGADLKFSIGYFSSGGLQTLYGVFFAVQPDATRADCERVIEAEDGGQGEITEDARTGETYCFRTGDGHIGRITVTALDADTRYTTFDLAIWPN